MRRPERRGGSTGWPRYGLPLTGLALLALWPGEAWCLASSALLMLGILGACNVADGQRRFLDWTAMCLPLAVLLALEATALTLVLTGSFVI